MLARVRSQRALVTVFAGALAACATGTVSGRDGAQGADAPRIDGGGDAGQPPADAGLDAARDEAPSPLDATMPPPDVTQPPADAPPPEDRSPVLEENAAEIVSADLPTAMACGAMRPSSITVRNTGSRTWTGADGYGLAPVGGSDPFISVSHVLLPDGVRVATGGTYTFAGVLTAPAMAGRYVTDWRMRRGADLWFGATALSNVDVTCAMMPPPPDGSRVVSAVAAERPDLLRASCVEMGGNNEFLFEVVRRLRRMDPRYGLNWKRGVVGDLSQDVVDYYYGPGSPTEGATSVYIFDVISGHCGPSPMPAWIDVTEATRMGGTIGRWTLAGRSDL